MGQPGSWLRSRERAVLEALMERDDRGWSRLFSLAAVAERSGYPEREAQKALADLLGRGLIRLEGRELFAACYDEAEAALQALPPPAPRRRPSALS